MSFKQREFIQNTNTLSFIICILNNYVSLIHMGIDTSSYNYLRLRTRDCNDKISYMYTKCFPMSKCPDYSNKPQRQRKVMTSNIIKIPKFSKLHFVSRFLFKQISFFLSFSSSFAHYFSLLLSPYLSIFTHTTLSCGFHTIEICNLALCLIHTSQQFRTNLVVAISTIFSSKLS